MACRNCAVAAVVRDRLGVAEGDRHVAVAVVLEQRGDLVVLVGDIPVERHRREDDGLTHDWVLASGAPGWDHLKLKTAHAFNSSVD
jgi:hypothetical protein